MVSIKSFRFGLTQSFMLMMATALPLAVTVDATANDGGKYFRRIATIPVFLNTDVDSETVAEIVAASEDGNLLIYTDSETENLGFVDITDPYNPVADGIVGLAGEPTSVAVRGNLALVAVNTSPDFVNPSGVLQVVDINSRTVIADFDLGGQPDSIAVSPDRQYACVAIENERDEDLGDGRPPQLPAGFVVVLEIGDSDPANWIKTDVDLQNVADKFPEDPEPEFVSINGWNEAVVTLQENNHIVIIDLRLAQITRDFPAGNVNLTNIDTAENDLIQQNSSLQNVPREPDGVVWTSNYTLATADEGDLDGGSRGYTLFTRYGWDTIRINNEIEKVVTRIGHYPEGRSENKGNEPEAVAYGSYDGFWFYTDELLFVGSERSSVVLVYKLPDLIGTFLGQTPELIQVLPTGVAPEGLLTIPDRDLLVVAAEDDARDDKIRSAISIYKRVKGRPVYPKIASANRTIDTPIPWGALSGLSSDPKFYNRAFAVHDSFYRESRIFPVKLNAQALISGEIVLRDTKQVLKSALESLKKELPNTDDFDPKNFVNDDFSVNLDLEGIYARPGGGFWVVSEGAGNLVGGVSDPGNRPFESPNMLIRLNGFGGIEQVVFPPLDLLRNQLRFGFEGVTAVMENGESGDGGEVVYVAFQREWDAAGDPDGLVRIGRYEVGGGDSRSSDANWTFAYYPLETPTSPNGGWVGNSEITALGEGGFLVIERDNQGGPDATIKRVYAFSTAGVDFLPDGDTPNFDVVVKELVRDLIADGDYAETGGLVLEKLEGMAIANGEVVIVNDNDGVDDSNGETQLFRFPFGD